MKARVKATGEIVEISEDCSYVYAEHFDKSYNINELEFLDVKEKSFPKDNDYWTRLEHQYAGMAMQGMLSNPDVNLDYKSYECMPQAVAATACNIAHALVKKMKEERK